MFGRLHSGDNFTMWEVDDEIRQISNREANRMRHQAEQWKANDHSDNEDYVQRRSKL